MKCPICGSFIELERMKFMYQQGRNIRVETTCECEKGHRFQKAIKARRKRREPLDNL